MASNSRFDTAGSPSSRAQAAALASASGSAASASAAPSSPFIVPSASRSSSISSAPISPRAASRTSASQRRCWSTSTPVWVTRSTSQRWRSMASGVVRASARVRLTATSSSGSEARPVSQAAAIWATASTTSAASRCGARGRSAHQASTASAIDPWLARQVTGDQAEEVGGRHLPAADQVEGGGPHDGADVVLGDATQVPRHHLPRRGVEPDPGERLAAGVGHHHRRVGEPHRLVGQVDEHGAELATRRSSYDVTRKRCGRDPLAVSTTDVAVAGRRGGCRSRSCAASLDPGRGRRGRWPRRGPPRSRPGSRCPNRCRVR